MSTQTDRILGTITNEGFSCTIREDSGKRVYFTADGDIDADGANGQSGAKAAYMINDKGTEFLENGGMGMKNGRVVFTASWGKDIVIVGPDGQPMVFPGGIIASQTWYRHRDKKANDPASYVDSETVPYIVVPPLIIQSTAGVVRGCRGRITNLLNRKSVECVVADKGPRSKIGELSIAAARAINLPSSPRNGGTEKPTLLYELWPGQAAPGYELQAS